MSRCNSCGHKEEFACICHSRCHHDCDCPQEQGHCNQRLVKDCICVEWSVLPGGTQTIFQTGGFRPLFASGYISFDCGRSDFVIVKFFLGNRQIGASINVFEESSVAFSFTQFDRITVECPVADPITQEACEGEINIVTRFPV